MTREDYRLLPLASVGLTKGVYEVYVRPSPSVAMWAALGAAVVAYEALCPPGQTLSEAVDKSIERRPVLTLGAIALVAGHLANVIPERFDLIHQIARMK